MLQQQPPQPQPSSPLQALPFTLTSVQSAFEQQQQQQQQQQQPTPLALSPGGLVLVPQGGGVYTMQGVPGTQLVVIPQVGLSKYMYMYICYSVHIVYVLMDAARGHSSGRASTM